jgi:hypothetical protein
VCNDDEAFVVHVEDEILTLAKVHRLQSAQTKVASRGAIDVRMRSEWGRSIGADHDGEANEADITSANATDGVSESIEIRIRHQIGDRASRWDSLRLRHDGIGCGVVESANGGAATECWGGELQVRDGLSA